MPAGESPRINSWCEIDVAALHHNAACLRRSVGRNCRLGIVVKSNAYGHGLEGCAREFVRAGVDWLVVNTVGEAVALRDCGIAAPLYLCGPLHPDQAGLVAQTEARVVLYDWRTAGALNAAGLSAGAPIRVHLKLETGMHRQGMDLADGLALGRRLEDLPGLVLEGLTSHLADVDDLSESGFARCQLAALMEGARAFRQAGMEIPILHTANSGAALALPEAHAGLVRVGIAAYGLWPSAAVRTMAQASGVELRPALSWRARIAQIKDVPAGASVGYGCAYTTPSSARLAILPVGYYEGYDRRLSNLGAVIVCGRRAPVCGRICMDMTIVDVTHIPGAAVGAVATLIGRDGEEQVSADEVAGWMDTINYEVVSRLHPDQPRFWRRADGSLEEMTSEAGLSGPVQAPGAYPQHPQESL